MVVCPGPGQERGSAATLGPVAASPVPCHNTGELRALSSDLLVAKRLQASALALTGVFGSPNPPAAAQSGLVVFFLLYQAYDFD